MLDRHQRQLESRPASATSRPQRPAALTTYSACIAALFGDHVPAAVGALHRFRSPGCGDTISAPSLRAAVANALRCRGRIDMAAFFFPQGADHVRGVEEAAPFLSLPRVR